MEFIKHLFKIVSSKKITQTLINVLILMLLLLLLGATSDIWGTFVSNVWLVIKPFFIGFVVAFVLNPFINWVQKYVKSRGVSVALVYIGGLAIVLLLISMAVPLIYNSITEMYPAFEGGLKAISKFISHNFNYDISSLTSHIQNIGSNLLKDATVLDTTLDVLNQALINVTNFLIYLILALYMSLTYESIRKVFKNISQKIDPALPGYLKEIDINLIRYVKAFAIGAVAQAITTSIMYLVIGHPNWIVLGLVSGVSSVIPYVGPIVSNLLGIVTSLGMGTTTIVILLVLIFIQSNVMSYVITPKIYSSQIDLSIMWVLFGILSGSTLFGVWGMVIAMPLLVIFKISYQIYCDHHRNT